MWVSEDSVTVCAVIVTIVVMLNSTGLPPDGIAAKSLSRRATNCWFPLTAPHTFGFEGTTARDRGPGERNRRHLTCRSPAGETPGHMTRTKRTGVNNEEESNQVSS